MLAPPPGETFDGAEEEKLPTKASTNNSNSDKVPLLTAKEPEATSFESSEQGKVRKLEYTFMIYPSYDDCTRLFFLNRVNVQSSF